MTLRHLVAFLAVLTCLETVLFVAGNWDLVYLSQPRSRLETAATAEGVRSAANRALNRHRLTRRHLETIAQVSARRGDRELNLRTLQRLASEYPADDGVVERYGNALRTAGRADEAEDVYRRHLARRQATRGGTR